MPAALNLVGQRFGRIVVLRQAKSERPGTAWTCRCDCLTVFVIEARHLRRKKRPTRSCGCLKDEHDASMVKHGQSGKPNVKRSPTSTYKSWIAMKARCTNPAHVAYSSYGGRGITVCDRWLNSFENFLADVGERPEGKTLDRFPNNDGNYEPGNVRWATRSEQQRNKRRAG